MFWNVQGAASQSFRRAFKSIRQSYNPDMVVVMEPRISGRKADNFIKASGFDRSHRVEAVGFSGGIWLLWRDQFDVEIVLNHKQFVHLKISSKNVLTSWVTAVYASLVPVIRSELWHHLNHLAAITNEPWIIGGDFNSILFPGEKMGGSVTTSGICKQFSDWFHNNGIHDLQFKGPRFTWSRGSLSKRLDRVICNKAWFSKYLNASILHLPKVESDHRPVLVRFDQTARKSKNPKPFRFMAAWLTDSRFSNFMENNWNTDVSYYQAASKFTELVQQWNKETFGNILHRKKRLLARIGGKSKRDWVLFGDRNTAYFHQKTLTRRRYNRIDAVKAEDGRWLYDMEDIKQQATDFFSKLYTSEQGVYEPYHVCGNFPPIDEYRMTNLANEIEDGEIQQAIFSMSPLKVPGVDGLHAMFYQTQWHIVGESFCKVIKDVFRSQYIPAEINRILLVLIPKTENPISFKMYRPISLCTVAYKTITKIIVNRLQEILPDLIGPHQTSFVPGRHITENIIVAQEIIHSMRRKKGRQGFMAIKVDLEKAYDRLSWNFIHGTLQELNLPIGLTNLIMACITIAKMNILWNGELTSEFSPGRGVRQGDPLSPYIFVLCIERLSHGILKSIQQGQWKPIRLGKLGTPLSHLFFADDLLLLSEASRQQAGIINKVLEEFCGSSGAKNIIDTVDKRLSGWIASHLSLAGRITLAQSVLQAIPVYVMQTINLPRSIKLKIDQLCRRFLWSGSAEHQKMSLVSWDMVCTPKSKGGLGFKKLEIMKHALIMKNTWSLITEPTKLSNQVLLTKYGVQMDEVPTSLPTRYGSPLWKAMGNIWEKTRGGIRWNISNGETVRFWGDCWVTSPKPLADFATQPIPNELLNKRTVDFLDEAGNWNWTLFSHLVPNSILLKIAAIHPPTAVFGNDNYFWGSSSNGMFSVRAAYELLDDSMGSGSQIDWRLAWNWKGPQSIRVFLWLLLHGRLKTREELYRRHVNVSIYCDRCGGSAEDILHSLRDCVTVRRVWAQLMSSQYHPNFFLWPLKDWLHINLMRGNNTASQEYWRVCFGVTVWRLWFWRNHVLFNHGSWDSSSIVTDIKARTAEILSLNTDGAKKGFGQTGAGGLLRDFNGNWIMGFIVNLGTCSVLSAELWGLLHGLRMAWEYGFRRIQVGVDNKSVVHLVTMASVPDNENATLIKAIRDLLERDWSVQLKHVYREANYAADFLASYSLNSPIGFHVLLSPPPEIVGLICKDAYGVAHSRLVLP
ncbi:reverse transcriptase domain-containing protein [Citrus sinensis]|uniref:Reverse transcriptase domain-containing protein n=1 Tax=Citrus sinensis TaxID=2711 RepID=A0ACB8JE03_CITSI|nr:reverse transcriptase domain-containing protein [Citrus sinensis]